MTYDDVHAMDYVLFDCPKCGPDTEGYIYHDTRNYGSGCSWLRCTQCLGPWGGQWELDDAWTWVKMEL